MDTTDKEVRQAELLAEVLLYFSYGPLMLARAFVSGNPAERSEDIEFLRGYYDVQVQSEEEWGTVITIFRKSWAPPVITGGPCVK